MGSIVSYETNDRSHAVRGRGRIALSGFAPVCGDGHLVGASRPSFRSNASTLLGPPGGGGFRGRDVRSDTGVHPLWPICPGLSVQLVSDFRVRPSFPERFHYLLLPWLIYIAVSVGVDTRFFRTVFLEELNKDYVRTANAKGASSARVLFVHVLRNALVPIITRVVIEIPFLFLGVMLLENFFGIPGLGNMLVDAINNADWPVIQAMVILGSLLYVAGNLLSDVLYAWADPRVTLMSTRSPDSETIVGPASP